MSNKLRKTEIKNKRLKVKALIGNPSMRNLRPIVKPIDVIITNDSVGKTITLADETKSFTIAFEQLEQYLK